MAAKMPPDVLSQQELAFIDKLYAGQYQTTAFMEAFDNDNYKSSAVMASRLLKQVKVVEEMKRREATIIDKGQRRLRCMIDKALDGLNDLLEFSSPMDTVKLRAITTILDRTGFPAKTEQEVSGNIGAVFQFVGVEENTFPAAIKPDEDDDDE